MRQAVVGIVVGQNPKVASIQRAKRARDSRPQRALEWECVTSVSESDDVNPDVQCNSFLPVEERRWCNTHSEAHSAHWSSNQMHW